MGKCMHNTGQQTGMQTQRQTERCSEDETRCTMSLCLFLGVRICFSWDCSRRDYLIRFFFFFEHEVDYKLFWVTLQIIK